MGGVVGVEDKEEKVSETMFWNAGNILRKAISGIISSGKLPTHVSFILDGNRRYARKNNLSEGAGHNAGFHAVINILKYSYELGIKYVSIFAFGIDNYKRKPDQVELLMSMMAVKMEEMTDVYGFLNQLKVRVLFAGNLELLKKPLKEAVEKLIRVTSENNKAVLMVCLPYSSSDEITHSVQMCGEGEGEEVGLGEMERFMYMGGIPEPDILVRTSGETRMSNFLLWQSACCLLYSPKALWPEIRWFHLAWAVFMFQRHFAYLSRKKHLQRLLLLPLM